MTFGRSKSNGPSYSAEEIDQAYEQARREAEPLIASFVSDYDTNPESIRVRWDDIRQLVFHVNGRIEYLEDRRTQLLNLTSAILAVSIASLIALVQLSLGAEVPLRRAVILLPFLIPSGVLLLGGFRGVYVWNRQNNPKYPFTKAYRVWRWHYRHSEPEELDTAAAGYNAASFQEQVSRFGRNLAAFKTRFLKADIGELIDQDITQLYVLIVNEKFKIDFVSELRNLVYSSMRWALIGALIGLALIGPGLAAVTDRPGSLSESGAKPALHGNCSQGLPGQGVEPREDEAEQPRSLADGQE